MYSSRLLLLALLAAAPTAMQAKNLVPERPGDALSYLCTWACQNYGFADDFSTATGLGGHSKPADYLTERHVFRQPGWVEGVPQSVRGDLIVLFDVGWDVPFGANIDKDRGLLGSQEVAEDKFPSCTGAPVERLKKLNQLCKDAGYRGAGLWIPTHAFGEKQPELWSDERVDAYFRERLRWSRDAGILYWKVDYGFRCNNTFRERLSALAREEAPDLVVEQARNSGPLNDEECPWDVPDFTGTGDYAKWGHGKVLPEALAQLRFSDVHRTYDVTARLSVPTTLGRVSRLLEAASGRSEYTAILNCEDEPYIAAALGCTMGIMRNAKLASFRDIDYNPARVDRRMTEVARALRWQRIAPPVAAGALPTVCDEKQLEDVWVHKKGETWADWVVGRPVKQVAPARVARNMELPQVDPGAGGVPFVVATRYPNGAVAVASLPRVAQEMGFYEPHAAVTLRVGSNTSIMGVFGTVARLRVEVPAPLPAGTRIWAQDLAADTAQDITNEVQIDDSGMTIDGGLLARIGTQANGTDDLSSPGLVLAWETAAKRVNVQPGN